MTGCAHVQTVACKTWELEPGDVYLTGVMGGGVESREVLGVLQRTPLGGALLEVRAPDGNVFRSHMGGNGVRRVLIGKCPVCGESNAV